MAGIRFTARLTPSPSVTADHYRAAAAAAPRIIEEALRTGFETLVIATHTTIMAMTPRGTAADGRLPGRLAESTMEIVNWNGLAATALFMQPAKALQYTYSNGTWTEAGETDFEYAEAVIKGRRGAPQIAPPTPHGKRAYAGPGFGPRASYGPSSPNPYPTRAMALMLGPVLQATHDIGRAINIAVLGELR